MLKKILGLAFLAALAFVQPTFAADIALDGYLRGLCTTTTAAGNGTAATATLNNKCGVITTETLSSSTNSLYTLTLTNSAATVGDIVLATVGLGTATTGAPNVEQVTTTAGQVVISVRQNTSTSFNGTLKINFFTVRP
jgi:hypothetical protein